MLVACQAWQNDATDAFEEAASKALPFPPSPSSLCAQSLQELQFVIESQDEGGLL
jgi:hypothetical protein